MAIPVVVEPQIQKDAGDCVIICLSMVFGIPYVRVCEEAIKIKSDACQKGLTTKEMMRVARALGKSLLSLPIQDLQLESETGILDVRKKRAWHAVVLFEGSVYNPADGLLYTLDAYLSSSKAVPQRFFRP